MCIPVVRASRVLTGPEIVGSRPVVVTFETFRWDEDDDDDDDDDNDDDDDDDDDNDDDD